MRENMGLYRGKREFNGDWVEGNLIVWPDGTTWILVYNPTEDWLDRFTVDPATVGEYTGETDKNEKQIFEGDVVATATGKPHEVMFADGEFFMDGTAIPFKWVSKFSVIGNVHDNPELKGE